MWVTPSNGLESEKHFKVSKQGGASIHFSLPLWVQCDQPPHTPATMPSHDEGLYPQTRSQNKLYLPSFIRYFVRATKVTWSVCVAEQICKQKFLDEPVKS